jgi:hypothetical protein
MTIGFNQPLSILPFDHQTKFFEGADYATRNDRPGTDGRHRACCRRGVPRGATHLQIGRHSQLAHLAVEIGAVQTQLVGGALHAAAAAIDGLLNVLDLELIGGFAQ